MDKLEAIFQKQGELLEKFNEIESSHGLLPDPNIPVNLETHQGQAVIKSRAWNITEELAEAMNELKNKPWKQKTYPVDLAKYYEEVVDAFHFLIELCILSGLDAQQLYDMYMGKASINIHRQVSGV